MKTFINGYYNLSEFKSHEQHPNNWGDLYIYSGDYKFYVHSYLSFGDYDNSCEVERANVRWFDENYTGKNAWKVSGMYGSESIVFNEQALSEPEIIEIFDRLESYPCLDDQLCSQVKEEMIEESWDAFGMRDFQDMLIKEGVPEDDVYEYSPDKLKEYYYTLLDAENKYIEIEAGGNVYFPNPFK